MTFKILQIKFFLSGSAIIVAEEDVATYTIKAVDDPRTLNKVLYMRPSANILSFNEIVALWEKKIAKTLEKIYVPESQLLKNIEGSKQIIQKSSYVYSLIPH